MHADFRKERRFFKLMILKKPPFLLCLSPDSHVLSANACVTAVKGFVHMSAGITRIARGRFCFPVATSVRGVNAFYVLRGP